MLYVREADDALRLISTVVDAICFPDGEIEFSDIVELLRLCRGLELCASSFSICF